MKTPKPLLLACLLFIQCTLTAQIQWYQNQDAGSPPPSGTVATMVKTFNSSSFIACYLWRAEDQLYTWKISKTNTAGTEIKTFFLTSIYSNVEFRVGAGNCVYVVERSFTPDYTPCYIVYKLDANLQLLTQRSITFPGEFIVYSLNAFELDNAGNLYFAGDGAYTTPAGASGSASFLLKTNRNLATSWTKIDSVETSFSRVHIDSWGRVWVVQDYYTFFPQVRIKRFAPNGQSLSTINVSTDVNRFSLSSSLDENDNLLLYGGKSSANGNAQSIYIKRINKNSGAELFNKTYFTAGSSQLEDLKLDQCGNIFALVTQNQQQTDQKTRIARINGSTGNINWTRTINYRNDSSNLHRFVMNDGDDEFYLIGDRSSCSFFSKGIALKMKKNGQLEASLIAPDSVAFQRSHSLTDGIIDHSNRLIAIGTTSDMDTVNNLSSYFRSFAVRFGNNNNCYGRGTSELMVEEPVVMEEDKITVTPKLAIYPNPVQNQLTVSNINPDEYDRMAVYNMQGAMLQQQSINTTKGKMDISYLPDGVYLLVLRSSYSLKETSIKFVVKK